MITGNLMKNDVYRWTIKSFKNAFVISTVALLAVAPASFGGKQSSQNSLPPPEIQSQLNKAGHYLKSGKTDKASPVILSALASADDVQKCLAIAAFTEPYGFPMLEARRQCVNKALSLCTSRQDFMEVALKSRQYQLFEITSRAIGSLVGSANSPEELYELARKSQEVALNDVAHMAMEKVFAGIKTVPDGLKFAADAKAMGMEDLERKAAKALIDDEENAHQLCLLLKGIEPLEMQDLNRYCLKKALDTGKTLEEYGEILDAARRNHEQDIYNVTMYRGRRLKIINQIKHDQAEYQKQLDAWKAGLQQDISNQAQQLQQQDQQSGTPKTFAPAAPSPSGF